MLWDCSYVYMLKNWCLSDSQRKVVDVNQQQQGTRKSTEKENKKQEIIYLSFTFPSEIWLKVEVSQRRCSVFWGVLDLRTFGVSLHGWKEQRTHTQTGQVSQPHLLGSRTGLPGPSLPQWLCWEAESPLRRDLCKSTERQNHCRWEPAETAPPPAQSNSQPYHLWPPPSDSWFPAVPPSPLLHSAPQPGLYPQWLVWSSSTVYTESLCKCKGIAFSWIKYMSASQHSAV